MKTASVYNAEGNLLASGLRPESMSDEARHEAVRIAAAQGDYVILLDSDGEFLVYPDGEIDSMDEGDWCALGLEPPEIETHL